MHMVSNPMNGLQARGDFDCTYVEVDTLPQPNATTKRSLP